MTRLRAFGSVGALPLAAICAAPIAFGIWSLRLGQDANWDLLNYHWYNPYAFVHWRHDQDITPAGIQSYQSPLFDLPWYLIGSIFPARVLGFVIGAVHSANFLLIYAIARRTLPVAAPLWRELAALAIAAVSVSDQIMRALLGTTFNDLIVSAGVLLSLWLALIAIEAPAERRARTVAFCAGCAIGVTMAGKLTAAPFALGLCAAFALTGMSWRRTLVLAVAYGLGAAAALAAIHGPWSLWLWIKFGNPLFPFFNGFFGSPLTTLPNEFDPNRIRPRTLSQWLFFPYYFIGKTTHTTQILLIDYRFQVANVLLPVLLVLRWFVPCERLTPGTRYLLAALALCYLGWAAVLDIYRYAVAIDLLIPLALALVIASFRVASLLRLGSIAALLLFFLVTSHGTSWERIPWGRSFIAAEPEDLKIDTDPKKTLVVILNYPVAYLVPLMPPDLSFVSIEPQIGGTGPGEPWTNRLKSKIDQPWDALYGLSSQHDWGYRQQLTPYRLTADLPTCRVIRSNVSAVHFPQNHAIMCRLKRTDGSHAEWPTVTDVKSR